MLKKIENLISGAIQQQLALSFGLQLHVAIEQPRHTSFGELALPVAFQLARQLKRSPKQIAEELAAKLAVIPGVGSFEIAGNGYINVRLDRGAYAHQLLHSLSNELSPDPQEKIVVEHTNINPNKAAHIGHLRNAILGDTFVRMLRQGGHRVEVQNYIDNTGVQVADVVVGFHYLERKSLSDVQSLTQDPQIRFDYLCWDLYARISAYYKEHPDSSQWRTETLHAIESGVGEIAELAHVVSDAIVQAHIATMFRLGIEYDVLPRESEILQLNFWATAFDLLKQRGAIFFEERGKNAGCWVMPASAFRDSNKPAETAEVENEEFGKVEDDSKVIVRSNGTVTYVGKDIAYQLWKFGLLGRDFHYRSLLTYPDGHPLSVTTSTALETEDPRFGHASCVFNVIDSRQSYLQDVVVAGLRALGFDKQAEASVHFSYEMVALSPRTCIEMGIELSEGDRRKPYVEVSGRKGLGVKADDLLDKLIETALAEVEDRHPNDPPQERRNVAEQIAIGALRYFMLKFTRNSVIAFDFHEALSFEGETGPYVQYGAVRAANIIRKFLDREGPLPDFKAVLKRETLSSFFSNEDLWQLLLLASKADTAIERAVSSGEPAHVAKYAFQLCQSFNNFYHATSVISEEDVERRAALLWLTEYVRAQLSSALQVLGIPQPLYM